MQLITRIGALVACVGMSFLAGAVGALLQGSTSEVQARYEAFTLPAWAPPTAAFGIVWPVLYLLIGIAAWRLWLVAERFDDIRGALTLWVAQLVVNAVWPWVFFGEDRLGTAVLVIVVLDLLVVATISMFLRHDRWAALLMAPYLAWILFATALNVAVWQLN